AGLAAAAGTGIQEPAVLVQVREQEIGIALERVEHAVAVMRVDVDIGYAADVVEPARGFDRDAAVVEDAEARGVIAARGMQTADGDERATQRPLDDRGERLERAADDRGRGLVHAGKRRRVARVEQTAATLRQRVHAVDVRGRVEILELRAGGLPR